LPLREDGACEFLSESGECTVYADRPDICRVDSAMDATGLSHDAAYRRQAQLCIILQRALGVPESMKVIIP
jgi:Fe-S-cluster containining protein